MGIADAVTLGLDPGRDKTGFAAVGEAGDLFFSGILPSGERERFLSIMAEGEFAVAEMAPWLRERRVEGERRFVLLAVVLGNGTGSGALAKSLVRALPREVKVRVVDEKGTTLEARKLYWRLHRPSWGQRFLPRALRVPSRPLDDLAAWAIVLRGFSSFRNAQEDV